MFGTRSLSTLARRLASFVGLVACFALFAQGARAQQVVISQFYGAGGNSGATYNRDFVELHNRGASAASLTGWSIQYASQLGTAWSRTNLSGSIPAGGYFLVQLTTTGTNGIALPTPDLVASPTIDMSGTTGKVALVASVTTLPAQVAFQVGTNNIQDFVGFGMGAITTDRAAYEGGNSVPTLSATLSAQRAGAGCTMTHDNFADFTTALPAPRNSATAALICIATGACCNGGVGTYTTSGACTGTYRGDFSNLGAGSYTTTSPANALEDISLGGAGGTIVATLDGSDDGAATFTLSPAMPFYGNRYTSLSVGANGHVSFLPGTTAINFANAALSTPALPNNIICPLWMDLWVRPVATVPGAHVYTAQKTSPNRFIVQWNKVSTRDSGTTTPDNLTFQVILFQDTGEVEVRYGAMNTTVSTPAFAATIGVEDMSGLVSTSVAGGSFAALNNAARLFSSALGNCSPPANDNCAAATTIAAIGTTPTGVVGTNGLATLDGGASGCSVAVAKDVWYAFQPTVTGSWDISTCSGTTQDTVLEIYDACGGSLVACADDNVGCGSGTQSFISTSLSSAQSYRIRVDSKGAGASGGAFTLVVVQSPPANDTCAGAVVIGSVPYTAPASAVNGPSATLDLDVTCNSGTLGTTSGVWFSYTPPTNGNLNVTQTSSNDTVVALFTGSCAGLTQVACSDPNALTFAVTGGTPYWILVGNWGTTAPTTNYGLTVDLVTPPANDTCAGAVIIAATPYTAPASALNGPGASSDLDVTCNSGTISTTNGLWFTYTPAVTGTLNLTQTSSNDTVVAVFTGSCAGLTQIACSDPNTVAVPVTGGTQYWILVGMWGTSAPGVNYGLTADFVAPLANDTCGTGTLIAVPSVTSGTTVGATAESPVPPTCNGPTGSGTQDLVITSGVWYRINVASTQTITLDTLASAYDSKIWVYTGACAALSCVTFNDDAQGTPFQSKVAWVAQAGVDYRILVAPYSTTTGAFTLTATGSATPSNDLCSSPTTIAGISGSIAGTTVGATGENNTASSAMPSCAAAYSFFDVWYSYTATCSGNLTLGTCGAYDTTISVHTTCPTLTANNQISGACNNDGPVGCTPGSQQSLAVTGGTTYLIRVVGTSAAAAGSAFTLTWNVPDTVPPTITTCPPEQNNSVNASCQAPVPNFTASVAASDACSGIASITQSPTAGTLVGVGVTAVTITVTDGSGNFSTCGTNFRVADTTAPTISICGPPQTGTTSASCTASLPNFTATTSAADNCGGVTLSQVPLAGTLVGPGTTPVVVTATDSSGNFSTCSTSFTVTDTTAPTITTCAPMQMATAGANCDASVPDFTATTSASDNCGSVVLTQSPLAGSILGLGTHSVTITATDGALNTATCMTTLVVSSPDTDGDLTVDCQDGCPTDPLKTAPGLCGCGVPDAQTTFYEDLDGDGFGDASVTQVACTAPVGYVALAGDCDDLDPDVNPGEIETCSNGIDDDCNGVVDDLTTGAIHNVTQNTYFCTIQAAIDASVAGDVISVAAGTYFESLTIDESITLLGANSGVDACSGPRTAETIVMPATGAATLAGTQLFVVVTAANVTIDGFTFDGDNPSLTSPFTANGANPDCDIGISAEAPYTNGDLVVVNNIVQNVFQFGLALGATGQPAKGAVVTNNKIQNVPYWAGVLAYDDYYAQIEDNCIQDAWLGVQTNNFYQPVPSGSFASISGNTITTETQVIAGDATYTGVGGILVNLHYTGASTWTVANNVVTNTTPRSADSVGIEVWTILSGVGLTIDGNDITDFDQGYALWNAPTTSTVNVSNGTVSGSTIGLLASNVDVYGDAASSSYLVSGVTFVGGAATTAGISVVDDAANANGATVSVSIANCDIGGGAVGIAAASSNGGDTIVVAHDNSITGQTGFAIENLDAASLMDATCNWYGSAAAQVIAPEISGLVTYTPWLVSGVDSNVADGFQPALGTCLGTPVTIALTSVTDVTCPGGSDGAVDVTPSGGSTPYSFLWTNGATTEDLVGVVAGSYSVTVTDANGSTATTSATVQPGVDVTNPVISTCPPMQGATANASCQATVPDFTAATIASDNCALASISQSPIAGSVVGLGSTSILITVTDASSNTTTCTSSFVVVSLDADGDGTVDCLDGCPSDPLKVAPGICGCGTADTDSDNDGTANCNDGCPTDPLKIAPGICGCGVADTDSDNDGTANCFDGCPNDPLKIAPGICGCGITDADSDNDGTANCNDGCPTDPLKIAPGQCGCGIADTDTDSDGTANCNDGCPNDPLKIAPGQCGCGIADTDTDSDGTADCNDGCPSDPLKIAPGTCGCGVSEVDTDADGLADCIDNCDAVVNPGQGDSDGDGVGNVCDNCQTIPNAAQGDCDGDLIGDACEIASGSPDCNLNGVPDTCDIALATSTDLNSNSIPDECEENGGTPFCFGESACPCGNNSAVGAGQGCRNNTGLGAQLIGSGLTHVSADGLLLTAVNLPATGFAQFIQGTAVSGAPFQDGKRCAAGTVIRLGLKPIASGTSSYPQGGDLPVSVRGFVPPAGGVRYYQTWYRNPLGPCGTGSNLSNGLSVVWAP